MRAEHHALKQVGALTIQDSSFHQANMIQQVLSQQSELQDNLQASINAQVKDSLLNALTEYTTTNEPVTTEEINNVNAATKNMSNEAILELLLKLTNKMDAMNTVPYPEIDPKTGKKVQEVLLFMRLLSTLGTQLQTQKPGRQDNATFKNRMGGSNKFCLPVRE